VTYTGEPAPLPAGVGDDDPRPLVYLTLGTVSNQAPALRSAVEGLAGLDARVLVTVGPDGDPAALGPVPDHVTVARWVNQADVLPHCAAVVSHGGSGTFLGALGLGLPQLCLPQAADQFRNAAAADRTGAGLSLAPDATTPDAVRDAVRRLLLEDGFRRAASGLADTIRAMPGPAEIVTVLERLVPEGR
jgi:MGT family glycosyltransferase